MIRPIELQFEDNVNKIRLHRRGARSAAALALAIGVTANGVAVMAQDAGQAAAREHIAPVYTGIAHDAVYDMVINGKEGIAVGAFGVILKSADAGASWTRHEAGTLLGLFGIAVNGEHRIIVGQRGTVLLGKPDGTWAAAESGTEARLLNVAVNAAGLAIAVGEFGAIMRSKDGGKTWEKRPIDWVQFRDDGYEPHLYDVVVQDDGRVLVGAEFTYVLLSEDGGETWRLTNKGEKSIFAMQILPDGSGYAVGQEGLVIRTADNGVSWETLDVNSNANLLGVWSSKQGEVVITGLRALIRSSDSGNTWEQSTDLQIIRGWFQPIATGEATFKSEAGEMHSQPVYIGGQFGTIARVLH